MPKKYKVAFWLALLALCAFAASLLWGDHGIVYWQTMRSEFDHLQKTNFRLHRETERLRTRLHRLQTDDAYLERYARERLGLVRPGEILYRLATPTPSRPSS